MLHRIVNKLAKVFKGRELLFDSQISDIDLLVLLLRSAKAFSMGMIRLRAPVMLGNKVKIFGKHLFHCSSGVTIGDYTSIDAIGYEGIFIGKSCSIGAFSLIKVSGSLTLLGKGIYLGNNVGIGDFAHIGGAGGVEIGDDTIIGANFSVHPEEHVFSDIEKPIRLQGVTHQGIKIGRDCWIGAKVAVLDGAIIGNGCVVAAGSIVKGEFPDNVVLGGVPARILKER